MAGLGGVSNKDQTYRKEVWDSAMSSFYNPFIVLP